ncbi:MAG: hypothetical protein GF331_26890 [Chitinivibrionales bacterium]|nr:hypothetical protein [Chitinivibrionales bacterium]
MSGSDRNIVRAMFDGLAGGETWTVRATTEDANGVVIHDGSTTFAVVAGDTVAVRFAIAPRYSMLNATFSPITEQVNRCVLMVDNEIVSDSQFAARTLTGESVKLSYDALPASPEGTRHVVQMDAYGELWGEQYLLYTGSLTIVVFSSRDTSYALDLRWVGPDEPPTGAAAIHVYIGSIGTVTINGTLIDESALPRPVAWFPLDGDARDIGPNANHGTIRGSVTPTADRRGNPSGAMAFGGSYDYIVRDQPVGMPSGNVAKSMCGWFKSTDSTRYIKMLFGFGSPDIQQNFQIGVGPCYTDGTSQWRLNGWGDSYDWRTGVLGSEYMDGRWHHCAVTYDGRTARVYFDGVERAVTSRYVYRGEASRIAIGVEIDLVAWDYLGALDDVRFYDRALTAAQVRTLAAR